MAAAAAVAFAFAAAAVVVVAALMIVGLFVVLQPQKAQTGVLETSVLPEDFHEVASLSWQVNSGQHYQEELVSHHWKYDLKLLRCIAAPSLDYLEELQQDLIDWVERYSYALALVEYDPLLDILRASSANKIVLQANPQNAY